MTNDLTTTPIEGSQQGKVTVPVTPVTDITKIAGLAKHDRSNPTFDYNNGGVHDNLPRVNIPGYGRTPFLGNSVYPDMKLSADPYSGTTLENETPATSGKPKSIAQLIAENKNHVADNSDNSAMRAENEAMGQDIVSEKTSSIKPEEYWDYIGNINIHENNDDLRAMHQSVGEATVRGAARFLGTTAQAFAEPFVNIGALIPMLISSDKKFSYIYDNPVTNAMDELNEKLKASNAIYSTKAQQDSDALSMTNLTSAHLWGEGVADGLGFTVGTLLNAVVTGGMMRAGSAALTASSRTATALAAAETGEALLQVGNSADDIALVGEILANPNKASLMAKVAQYGKGLAKSVPKILPSYLAASAEGGVEARDLKRQLKPILDEQVKAGEITQEQADRDLQNAMNTTYALNVGIVGFSTHLQFGGMLFRGGAQTARTASVGLVRNVADDAAQVAANTTRKTVTKFGAETWASKLGMTQGTRWSKFVNGSQYGYHFAINPFTEMAEEGSQFLVSNAIKDHYDHREGHTYGESIAKASNELFNTKEGNENLLIGALLGGLGAYRSGTAFNKEQRYNNTVANYLNDKIFSKDSHVRLGMEHHGRIVNNNAQMVAAQTQSQQDGELIDLINEDYFAEIAEYAHKTGTTDVVKQYISKFNALNQEDFNAEFPTLNNMSEDSRKAMVTNITNQMDELTALRKHVDEKYRGLEEYHKDHIYRLNAFHNKTNKLYEDQITQLREVHGVDVTALNKEAIAQYQKDKDNNYSIARSKAYAEYQKSLADPTTAIKESEFNTKFDIEKQVEINDEFDKSLEIGTIAREPNSNGVYEKRAAKVQGNVTAYILQNTNYLVEKALADKVASNGFATPAAQLDAENILSNYLNLQESYINSHEILRHITNPANRESIEKGYAAAQSELTVNDVNNKWSEPYSKALDKLKNTKKDDLATADKEVSDTIKSISDRIIEVTTLLNNKNLSTKDNVSLNTELQLLSSYKGSLATRLEELKKKYADPTATVNDPQQPVTTEPAGDNNVVDNPNPVGTPNQTTTTQPAATTQQQAPQERPSDKVVKLREDLKKQMSEIVNSMSNAEFNSRTIAHGVSKRANSKVKEVLDRYNKVMNGLTLTTDTLLTDINKVTEAKEAKAIEKRMALHLANVKNLEAGVEKLYNDYSADLDLQDAESTVEDETVITDENQQPNNNTNDNVEFDSELLTERFDIEGTVEERMDQMVDIFHQQFAQPTEQDDEVRNTVGVNEPTRKQMTFDEYCHILYGDSGRQRGVLQDYIAAKHGEEAMRSIYANPYDTMVVLWHKMTKNGTASISDANYRELFLRYCAANKHRKFPLEIYKLANLDYFLNELNEEQFITNPTNIRSSDYVTKKYNQDTSTFTLPYADMVTANRKSITGNETLERHLDPKIVFEGAASSLQVSDMNVSINGQLINARDIVNQILQGDYSNASLEVIGNIPIDVLNSNGESIGHVKTYNELVEHEKNKWNLPSNKGYAFERNRTIENRINLLHSLASKSDANHNYTVATQISRSGIGHLDKAEMGFVADNIRVPGSKVLIAKNSQFQSKLVETGNSEFTGKVHNAAILNELQNGVSYIAIPVNSSRVSESDNSIEPVYMIMPLQSTLLDAHKGETVGRTKDATEIDVRPLADKSKNRIITKENSVNERIKMSILTAIDINIKYASNVTLTASEQTIKDSLAEQDYDIVTAIGLQNYIKKFAHVYDKTPVDLDWHGDSDINIDNILNNRIKEKQYSVIRVSNQMIEIGKVENGIATVTALYINNNKVHFSQYSFKELAITANRLERKYVDLTNTNYKDKLNTDMYNALSTVFLRVDADKLNTTEKYTVPLVNLIAGDKSTTISNGNVSSIIYDSVVNEQDPIQMNGLDFDTYNDYAKSILRSDIATFSMGDKHFYSANKPVHVNLDNLSEDKESLEVFAKAIHKELASRKKDVKVIGKFAASEIVNFTKNSDTIFAKAFTPIYNSLVGEFDITFNNNGTVEFKSKNSEEVIKIPLTTIDNIITTAQLRHKIEEAISKNRTVGEEVTVAIVPSETITRSPVERKDVETSATIDPTDITEVITRSNVNDGSFTPNQQAILNEFSLLISEDDSFISELSQYAQGLMAEGMSEIEAHSLLQRRANAVFGISDNEDSEIRYTPSVIGRATLATDNVSIKDIAIANKVLNPDGTFIEFNTAERAMVLASKLNVALKDTAFSGKVIEKVSNAVAVRYIVYIANNETAMDLFGDNYVELLNAVNENKGFIPFVAPRVINSVKHRLCQLIYDELVRTNGGEKSVDTIINNDVATWKASIVKVNELISRLNAVNPNSKMLDIHNNKLTMLQSLVDNAATVKDMVIRELVSDNMIKFNPTTGNVSSTATSLSFFTGESSDEEYSSTYDDTDQNDVDDLQEDNDDEVDTESQDNNVDESTAHFKGESISIDHRENASAVIKRFLQGIKDVRKDKAGNDIIIRDMLDNEQYLNYQDVYNKLLGLFCNKHQNVQSIVETLTKESETDPVCKQVLANLMTEINDTRSSIPTELAKLVNKNRVDLKYATLLFNKQAKKGIVNTIGDSNKSDIRNVIVEQWQSKFIESDFVKTSSDGTVIANVEKLQDHNKEFSIVSADITKLLVVFKNFSVVKGDVNHLKGVVKNYNELLTKHSDKNQGYRCFKPIAEIKTADDFNQAVTDLNQSIHNFVNAYTKPLGINISPETIDKLIYEQKAINSDKGITRAFLNENLSNFKAVVNSLSTPADVDLSISNINSRIKKPIKLILDIEARVNKGVDPVTYRDRANKAIYSYANYKYMDEVLSDLQSTDGALIAEIRSTAFGANCHLLNNIEEYNNNNRNGDNSTILRFAYADALQVMDKKNKVNSVKLDAAKEGDIEVFKLMQYYNRGSVNGVFYYPTLSDGKSIMLLPMTKINSSFVTKSSTDTKLSNITITKAFELIVRPEIERILASARVAASDNTIEIAGYSDGAAHFILNNYLDEALSVHTVKQENGTVTLPSGKGTITDKDSNVYKQFEAECKAKFEKQLYKIIENKIETWREFGIVKSYEDANGATKESVYLLDNNVAKNLYKDAKPFEVASDFVINNMVFNMGCNQIFMGDTAAYWNGGVNSTIGNMSKRLAGHRGPGEVGTTATKAEIYTCATVSCPLVASESKHFLDSIRSLATKGKSADAGLIDSTDGQELTSMYEDMYNRVSYSGVSRALFDALYNDKDAVIYKAFERMFAKGATKADENFNYEDAIEEHLKKKDLEYLQSKNVNATKEEIHAMFDTMENGIYAEYVKMVHQPVKPMYFGTNSKTYDLGGSQEVIRTATYIKSSSFALRPSLTKNFTIDKLRKSLDYSTYLFLKEQRNLDKNSTTDAEYTEKMNEARAKMVSRFSFDSAIKIGANTNVLDTEKSNVFDLEQGSYKDLYTTMMGSVKILPRRGFRIQQDLPFKWDKEYIGVGSQERKLLFNGLLNVESVKDLKARYDELYRQFYKIGYDNLINELMVDGKVNYAKLSEIAIKEGLSRKYDDNDIAELRTNEDGTGFENKVMFHRRDTAIESLMLSIVNNRVIKMKFPGRSFVLGTEAGFHQFTKDAKLSTEINNEEGMIFTSKYEGKLMSHGFRAIDAITMSDGKEYKKDDYIAIEHLSELTKGVDYKYQPDQILIPSYFKDSKGRLINLKEGYNANTGKGKYISLVDGRLTLKEDMFDPEILKTFGFRIPTQGHNSMASMEVVGFTDNKVGELVIATKVFVDRMGSDFDIDKLYMYRYSIDKKKNDTGKKVFTKNNEDAKYAIINELISIHHEVFENPDTTIQKSINSPLSYGFFKQEYRPSAELETLYNQHDGGKGKLMIGEFIEKLAGDNAESLCPLTDSYQSNFYLKGKMGKDGIAIFSSRSVVNAVLQQSRFENNPIAMGTSTKDGFDNTAYNFKLAGLEFKGENFGNNETIDGSGYTVADVISWYQSTSVDNAKLNKLHKLNINETTIDVVNFLNQAGFQEQTLWFINQPIIKEYAKLLNTQQGLVGKAYSPVAAHIAVREKFNAVALAKYNKESKSGISYRSANSDAKFKSYNFRDNSEFTSYKDSIVSLASGIESFKDHKSKLNTKSREALSDKDVKFFGEQLAILEEFIAIHENQAAKFKSMASILNTDSKGLGASVSELVEKRHKLLNIRKETAQHFQNFDKVFGTIITKAEHDKLEQKGEDVSEYVGIGDVYIKPNGVVGSALAYSVGSFEKVFANEFIQFSPEYQHAISQIANNASKWGTSSNARELSRDLIDHYKRYAHSFAMRSIGIDIEAEYNRLMIDEYEVSKDDNGKIIESVQTKQSVASKIINIQGGRFSGNSLIASLIATPGSSTRLANIRFNNIAGNNDTDGKILTALHDLIQNDPVLIEYDVVTKKPYTGRQLVKDLFVYSEITGGIQRFGELVKFMPHELKKNIGFTQALNNTTDIKPIDNKGFLIQFIQHKPAHARAIMINETDKGVIQARDVVAELDETINEVTINKVIPVDLKAKDKVNFIFVDPFKFQVTTDGKTGPFLNNGEPSMPLVITKTFYNKATGIRENTLFKLVLESDTDTGLNSLEKHSEDSYKPSLYQGQYIYTRLDELGNGSKTEYDANVSPVTSKQSALNGVIKSKYRKLDNAEGIVLDGEHDLAKAVFGNYSKADVVKLIRAVANNKSANPIARTMALLYNKLNVSDKVVVISQNELINGDSSNDTEFIASLRRSAKLNNNPMFYKMNRSDEKSYIVVNEDYYKNDAATLEELQTNFMHELGHMILDNDVQYETNNDNVRKLVSSFRKSGEDFIKEVTAHLKANWEHPISLDEVMKYMNGVVDKDANGSRNVPGNLTHTEFMKTYRKYYGLINFHEFYAEVGSNDEFVEMLNKIDTTKAYSEKESNVLKGNRAIFGTSILGTFLELFKQFFNKLLTLMSTMNHDGKLEIRNNSVAKYALYELFVSASRHRDKISALTSQVLELPNTGVTDTLSEDLFKELQAIESKGTTLAADIARDKITEVAESDSEYGDMFANLDTVRGDFAESSDRNVIGVRHSNEVADKTQTVSEGITDKVIDDILRKLNSNGRLDYACKI